MAKAVGSECVCVCGARAGCVYKGSSSPDMKRNSFIIANLQNINIRASTQSVNLSLCVSGPPPCGLWLGMWEPVLVSVRE